MCTSAPYAARVSEEVEIRRSSRRRRTVSARREQGRIVVLMPAGLSPAQEQRFVDSMVAKIQRSEARRNLPDGESDLLRRARRISTRHLDGRAQPREVRWVSNQERRWGSCTPATGTIRLSDRLASMPAYVVDYVLLHELAHLLEASHNERFWALVGRDPMTERARGFLEGVAHAAGLDMSAPDLAYSD